MSDTFAIKSLFDKETGVVHQERNYTSKQYLVLQDNNGKAYTGAPIKFETNKIDPSSLILWRDSFLEVPFKMSSTGTAYTASTRLAFKTSVLSLIQGLTIRHMGNGASLVSEQSGSTGILANIKLILESSFDFIKSNGHTLHYFGIDNNNQVVSTGIETIGSAFPAGTIITPAMVLDPLRNRSLLNRISVLEMKHKDTLFSTCAMIPLRLIHDLFDKLDFPLYNCPLKIDFYLSGNGNNHSAFMAPVYTPDVTPIIAGWTVLSNTVANPSVFTASGVHGLLVGFAINFILTGNTANMPALTGWAGQTLYILTIPTTSTFTVSLYPGGTALAATVTGVCQVQLFRNSQFNTVVPIVPNIGAALTLASNEYSDRGYTPNACSLLLCSVKLNDSDLTKLKSQASSGAEKMIQYNVSELYTPYINSSLAQFSVDVTGGGQVCPQRLYVCAPATGTIDGANAIQNSFPSYIGVNHMYNTNVIVNNTENLYGMDISNPRISYAMLEDIAIGSGESPTFSQNVSYEDWRNGFGLQVFDLSRIRTASGTSSVNLKVKAQIGQYSADPTVGGMTNPVNYDLVVISERLVSVVLKFSDSSPTMLKSVDGDIFSKV